MNTQKMNLILLLLILVGIGYVAFYQPIQHKENTKRCFDTAVALEKARHAPVDDGTVTNQDISSFQKNFIACMAD